MTARLTNKRLLACARLMKEYPCEHRRAADIGTDHGYLAAYLVETGICESAVAADINPKPLDSARRTVSERGLTDRIDLVLSDGLDSVPRDGMTDIICAGMGGELIADILSRCEWAKECTLYLQPMSKPEYLRRWLYEHSFEVQEEIAQRDGRFVYSVMCVRYAPEGIYYDMSDDYLAVGVMHPALEDARAYISIKIGRLEREAEGILTADPNSEEGKRRLALVKKLKRMLGYDMVTVGDVYDFLDSIAPFSGQQSYDNSGICAGSRDIEVTRILTALDITHDVVDEAEDKDCQLVISHHPVIFRPIRVASMDNPAVRLAALEKAAICAHTSFDSAEGGMNDLLAEKLGLKTVEVLDYDEGKPMGYVCETDRSYTAEELARLCKERLGCTVVRFTPTAEEITRVGICSGSGGGLLNAARAKGCPALITADCKHSDLVAARNDRFCLIDAGHYHTENIFHEYLAEKLTERFPSLEVIRSKAFTDPAEYII